MIPLESTRDVCVGGIMRVLDDLDGLDEMAEGVSSSKSPHLVVELLIFACICLCGIHYCSYYSCLLLVARCSFFVASCWSV